VLAFFFLQDTEAFVGVQRNFDLLPVSFSSSFKRKAKQSEAAAAFYVF